MADKSAPGQAGSPKFRAADLSRLRKMLDALKKQEQSLIEAGHTMVVPGSTRASALKDAESLERVLKAIEG
ncbi:hypothetical protein NPS53_09040 [Pseudomonas putida]|uniref:hypothetical protein n=1 Tax=Pseudomonas putida TaxID=303 RepID=UPI0023633047|nr:hypothetical protein [Pseudomonas putida]MDD2139720.1 hypothetical protein [Pseudomonas putida]HDS1721644.1 hypothetical protein [Pseudomonas putida]